MQISAVDSATGKIIPLEVTASNTVAEVKAKIQEKEGVPPAMQNLKFRGYEMMDFDTMDDWGIEGQCKVELIKHLNVHVDTLAGEDIALMLSPNCSIRILKAMVHRKKGVPPEFQRLTFNGQMLDDDRTLASYNFQDEQRLCLVSVDAPLPVKVFDTGSRRHFTVMATPSFTIGQVKTCLQDLVGIPADKQDLHILLEQRGTVSFLDPELEDHERVGYRDLELHLFEKD